MRRRYTRSSRSSKNTQPFDQLREQMLRELTREATALLQQFTQQLNQQVQMQMTSFAQGIVPEDSFPVTPSASATASPLGNLTQLLGSGVRYLATRPRTSRHTEESARSIASNSTFKLSKSQAAVELQSNLSRGDRNL